MKNADHELDELALTIARQMHAAPRPQAQTGGAAPPALLPPEELADQIRPHLTPELVEFLGGPPPGADAALFGGGGGAGKKPFNFANFVTNLNKILPLVTTLIGAFGGPKIPPITIPVPTGPSAAPPAGAQ